MKKVFFLASVLLGLTLLPINANAEDMLTNAQNVTSVQSSVAGDYEGNLTYVSMNGKEKNPVEDLITEVTQSTGSNYKLALESFQIGSMPGKITITADNIPEGNFSGNCTVTLTIAGGDKDFTGTITGILSNGTLSYTVDCNATYLFVPFHAIVKYEGQLL